MLTPAPVPDAAATSAPHGGVTCCCRRCRQVKLEVKPFGAGAMRECYAMKKLSTFTTVSSC